MMQQGQVFPLTTARGQSRWVYRYRLGGRDSRRVQRGGFVSEQAAAEALERALGEQGLAEVPTLAERRPDVHAVDVTVDAGQRLPPAQATRKATEQEKERSPLTDSNR